MNGALYVGLLILTAILLLQWLTYRKVAGRRDLREGDIVLYVNPGEKDKLNNMITEVLHHFANGLVRIRGRGDTLEGSTTSMVSRKYLHLLPVDRNFPIQVPTEPIPGSVAQAEGRLRWNQAKWSLIPLDWFSYLVPPGRN